MKTIFGQSEPLCRALILISLFCLTKPHAVIQLLPCHAYAEINFQEGLCRHNNETKALMRVLFIPEQDKAGENGQ